MAWYLKWPSDSGTNVDNNKLCQISGIATTGIINVAILYAENIPAQSRTNYLFDGRRTLNSTVQGGSSNYIYSNGQFGTSNWRVNGTTVGSSGTLTTSRLAGDTVSFDTNAQPNGVIAIGARFNETEHMSGLAVSKIVITDTNGTHVIDMAASGGSANEFTSTDGVLTLKLFNFSGSAHWVYYDADVSKVGLGWGSSYNFATLAAWIFARKTATVHQTALCSGDLGAALAAFATTDFPAGALASGVVEYAGNNHSSLAKLRHRLDVLSSNGLTIVENLHVVYGGSLQWAASAQNNNVIRNCYVEHLSNPGSNGSALFVTIGGRAENCVVKGISTASKLIRPSGTGIIKSCLSVGGENGILTEWTSTEIRNCYAVDAAVNDYWFPNGRPPAAGDLASSDASAGADVAYRDLLPADNFVDYANSDYRIKSGSPLHAAGIGAFFENVTFIGEGTFSIGVTAGVVLSGSKIGHANSLVLSAAAAVLRGCKIGTAQLITPLATGIELSAAKVGVGDMPVQVNADVNLYAGNVYIGTGTFSVSAEANVALVGSKVGCSHIEFTAAAAAYLQATKTGTCTASVSATSALQLDGYKVGYATAVVLASATVSLSGSRVIAESAPVTVVFIRTSSRLAQKLKTSSCTGHNLKTSSRYQYHLNTFSGGDHA